jgi:hypothetical protein
MSSYIQFINFIICLLFFLFYSSYDLFKILNLSECLFLWNFLIKLLKYLVDLYISVYFSNLFVNELLIWLDKLT